MKIDPIIANRRSILAFDEKTIDDATLFRLFEAARWAPSAYNEQPWRFIVARRGEAGFDLLLECLAESNRLWAKQSAIIFLTIAGTSLTQSGKPNRHALHDLGLAMGNITFQGNQEGIEFHQMGGFDADKAVSMFGIPEGFEAVAVVAGGYPGTTESLPENLRARAERPRTRKSPDEIVFSNSFGHPHPIFIHPAQPN